MTVREIVEQSVRTTLASRSLWLFGFFVGLWSGGGGSGGGAGGSSHGAAGAVPAVRPEVVHSLTNWGAPFEVPFTTLAIVAAIAGLGLLLVYLRLIGEGALIEGVTRQRRGGTMSTREGWRAGLAHSGVILRIALLYLGTTVASVALGVASVVFVFRALGVMPAVVVAVPVVVVLVPWLVTLYLLQAFATRIAVLEDRRTLDAIAKARLFLHRRIPLGLRLLVAAFVGGLLVAAVSAVILLPIALLLIASTHVVPIPIVIGVCVVVGLPLICVLTAILGTYRSSVWTLGYLSQVDA